MGVQGALGGTRIDRESSEGEGMPGDFPLLPLGGRNAPNSDPPKSYSDARGVMFAGV